jgi:hypothetical protein
MRDFNPGRADVRLGSLASMSRFLLLVLTGGALISPRSWLLRFLEASSLQYLPRLLAHQREQQLAKIPDGRVLIGDQLGQIAQPLNHRFQPNIGFFPERGTGVLQQRVKLVAADIQHFDRGLHRIRVALETQVNHFFSPLKGFSADLYLP